jgi:hypothetical protein
VFRFLLLLSFGSLLSGKTLLTSIIGIDGSVCGLYKDSGNSVYASYSCATYDHMQNAYGVIWAAQTHNSPGNTVFGIGPLICLVGINTTQVPQTMGSLGTVPAQGIAWSCTPGDGKTIVAGTAVWP